jgi:hypothetical protein
MARVEMIKGSVRVLEQSFAPSTKQVVVFVLVVVYLESEQIQSQTTKLITATAITFWPL